jgi:hypothetical protein
MLRCGIVLKPSTLLHFHHVLTKRKYQTLFSSKRGGRPGSKGPAQELIDAVVEMKRRNLPGVVRELLIKSRWPSAWTSTRTWCAGFLGNIYGQESGSGGPSWLTFLGQAKDKQFVELRPVSL